MTKESDYLLSNQEIIGGLKSAIARGATLKQAMMTFYQAGYDKSEIEDAARSYMNQQKNQEGEAIPQKIEDKKEDKKEEEKKEDEKKKSIKPEEKTPPKDSTPKPSAANKKEVAPQKVSSYDSVKKKEIKNPKSNALTIILVVVLLVLLGVLAAVFLFKDELVRFINSMFA